MSKTTISAPADDRFEEIFQFIDKMTMKELKSFVRKLAFITRNNGKDTNRYFE